MGSNRTDVGLSLADRSLTLESGVDIDESLVSRSPLVRTLAPVFRFFRSRAGESRLCYMARGLLLDAIGGIPGGSCVDPSRTDGGAGNGMEVWCGAVVVEPLVIFCGVPHLLTCTLTGRRVSPHLDV